MTYKYLLVLRFNGVLYYFPFKFYWDAMSFLSDHKDYYYGCRYSIYNLSFEEGGILNDKINKKFIHV